MRYIFSQLPIAGTLLVLCVAGLSPEKGRAEEGSEKPAPEKVSFPDFPALTLSKSKSIEGDGDPSDHWAGVVAKLSAAAAAENDATQKSRQLLAAANIVLARQVEPCTSRAILNLPTESVTAQRDAARPYLASADTLIREAVQLLATIPSPDVEHVDLPAEDAPERPEPSIASDLTHSAHKLKAFLDGQRAFLMGETEDGDIRRAASALAPHLEDPDRTVAAAARLWQALLRGLEPDPTAALHILSSPLATLYPDTWPFGLYSRVLRCRYQGVQGAWSSALVMLVHIEEQLESWVPDVAHRGDARRLFAYTRLDVLKRWHDALPPERETERNWCANQAAEIVKFYFGVETSILRLDPAIPIVVSPEGPREDAKVRPE